MVSDEKIFISDMKIGQSVFMDWLTLSTCYHVRILNKLQLQCKKKWIIFVVKLLCIESTFSFTGYGQRCETFCRIESEMNKSFYHRNNIQFLSIFHNQKLPLPPYLKVQNFLILNYKYMTRRFNDEYKIKTCAIKLVT